VLRILRAFAWMRWRVLVNSFERTGSRDRMERLSLAIEQIVPFLAVALMIPAALGLAGLAGYTGVVLASQAETPITFEVLRYLMLAAIGFTVIGPILLPASERTNAVRLLLLPIPRRDLYVAQSAGAIADPWILLLVPVVLALPVGLAIGGATVSALIGLIAGVLLVVVLVGLSSLVTTVVYLLVRDRRRGELLALLFIVVLPLLGMLPGLMPGSERRSTRQEPSEQARRESMPPWVRRAAAGAFAVMPSELYRGSVLAVRHGAARSARPLAGLAAATLLIHGLGLLAFGRVLGSPGSVGSRRSTRSTATRTVTIPGISAGASAVAMAQMQLGLRTPRGRSILISPIVAFAVFAVLMRRGTGQMEFGFIALNGGIGLAAFASAICLLSILPFAMNQFAIDRSGLTLELLSPLTDLEILIGKAIANAAIAAAPALVCVTVAYVMFPSGSPALWLSVPLGALAAYALAAPAAAVLSAVFPRAVDLNSIGSGSNAHGIAGLVGMFVFLLGAAPPVLLALLATVVLERPAAAPIMLLVWCALAIVISRLLFIPVAALLKRRRENLGMVV
jgi:hypothetical protein